ncbi:MAG: response regulator [Chloroflexota bacterium]
MSLQTSTTPKKLNNNAEGDADKHELLDPPTALRTSTIPAVNEVTDLLKGDTGVNFMVTLDADGKDVDDYQDASLTQDETTLKKSPNAKIEMKPMTLQSPILIVEDTVELAEVIQATLEAMGLDSIYETHGRKGLEHLKANSPEIIIMDIGLPDITGWKMLDGIKEHYASAQADMPTIIVITAYGDPANRLIGKLQNIHSYLLKPFTPDQVEQVVGMALRGEKPEDPNFGGEPSVTG